MVRVSHQGPEATQGRIILWVEDTLTKEYLLKIWGNDSRIFNIRVAPGRDSIKAVVHDLWKDGVTNVFGLVDKDFGPDAPQNWNNPQATVFRLPVFEVENYLLDWTALAGCGENALNRTTEYLEEKARAVAGAMIWWMSCRAVLDCFNVTMTGDFPQHPGLGAVPDRNSAILHIQNAPWYQELAGQAGRITAPGRLDNDLDNQHAVWRACLASGEWTRQFSGKEIFRAIRGTMVKQAGRTTAQMDEDLAKAVGEWQFANNAVPSDIADLSQTLKAQAGI
jgi:hypothetical protein